MGLNGLSKASAKSVSINRQTVAGVDVQWRREMWAEPEHGPLT